MILYNRQTNKVELSSTILNSALLNPSLYTLITLKSKLVGGTYLVKDLLTSGNFTFDVNKVYFNSVLFGQALSTDLIPDGVYELLFTTNQSGIVQVEKVCCIVDNKTFCTLLTDEQKIAYLILKETRDCTCNCDELNNIYKTLIQNDTNDCSC
jgi:hypothetical protein